MDNAQVKRRGGDPDGPVSRPKDASPKPEQAMLDQEVDDTFPASDPPASTQPVGKEPVRTIEHQPAAASTAPGAGAPLTDRKG